MKPYRPKTYSFEDAAHLLRRAGFGGTPEEIEKLRALGPELAVEQLLTFSPNDGTNPNPHDLNAAFDDDLKQGLPLNRALARSISTLYGWWVHKMLSTNQPLKEKLTLFWHGHFATSGDKVRSSFALQLQNELFRRMGADEFEPLVLAVSKDPAMLRYLDNDKNTKAHPNENFARELMELFTMGVGNYTEKDIQESARAFTGWTFIGPGRDNVDAARNPTFTFKTKDHDTGIKNFLGQSGNFDGTDIVRIVSGQPATAKFMTRKLWRFFVNEEVPEAVQNDLIAVFTQSKGNIGTVLRAIFNSEEFYDDKNRYALIKSPAEYVIGAMRASRAKLSPEQERGLWVLMTQQYQSMFDPPNVKGWDGGREWIDDSSILNRLNFVGMVVSGKIYAAKNPNAKSGQNQSAVQNAQLTLPTASSAKDLIEALGRTYLGSSPTGSLKKTLERLGSGQVTPEVAKTMAYLVLASPQYHLA